MSRGSRFATAPLEKMRRPVPRLLPLLPWRMEATPRLPLRRRGARRLNMFCLNVYRQLAFIASCRYRLSHLVRHLSMNKQDGPSISILIIIMVRLCLPVYLGMTGVCHITSIRYYRGADN